MAQPWLSSVAPASVCFQSRWFPFVERRVAVGPRWKQFLRPRGRGYPFGSRGPHHPKGFSVMPWACCPAQSPQGGQMTLWVDTQHMGISASSSLGPRKGSQPSSVPNQLCDLEHPSDLKHPPFSWSRKLSFSPPHSLAVRIQGDKTCKGL